MNIDGEQERLRDLIQSFLAGDQRCFATLKDRIARFVASRYSGSSDDREDLVAEILRTILLNFRARQFQGKTLGELNSYILGIARLKVMQAVQRGGLSVARLPDGMVEKLPDSRRADPDSQAVDRDFVAKVLAAIDPKNRRLLVLKFQDGWSDQEIADQLRMTKNAASTAISRAVRKAQELKIVKEFLYQRPGEGDLDR